MISRQRLRRVSNRYVKFHGSDVQDDWLRVKALAQLVDTIPEISTARPISIDVTQETISYQRLNNLQRIADLPHTQLLEVVRTLGRAIAKIHAQGMTVEALRKFATSPALPLELISDDTDIEKAVADRLPVGFFHGDCWHANVLVANSETLILIDPIPRPWILGNRRYLRANGIADIATLHMSFLYSHRLPRLLTASIEGQIAVGDTLINSYLEYFDAADLRRFVLRLSRAIAITYISSYPTRINPLVGRIKLALSKRRISVIDKILAD